jgi:hypothetical protein
VWTLGPVADKPVRPDAAEFDAQDEAVADIQLIAVDQARRRVELPQLVVGERPEGMLLVHRVAAPEIGSG